MSQMNGADNLSVNLSAYKKSHIRSDANNTDNDDETKLSLMKAHRENESFYSKRPKRGDKGVAATGHNPNQGSSSKDIEAEIDRDYERHPKPQT